MDFKRILIEIFGSRELTLCNKVYTLNKWTFNKNNPYLEIDSNLSDYLIEKKLLVEDSGNFETGEVHYRLDHIVTKNLIEIEGLLKFNKEIYFILRELRLNKLLV